MVQSMGLLLAAIDLKRAAAENGARSKSILLRASRITTVVAGQVLPLHATLTDRSH